MSKKEITARDYYSSAKAFSKQATTDAGRNALRHNIPKAVETSLEVSVKYGGGIHNDTIADMINKSLPAGSRHVKVDEVGRWMEKAHKYGCCTRRKEVGPSGFDRFRYTVTKAHLERWRNLPINWVGTRPDGEFTK